MEVPRMRRDEKEAVFQNPTSSVIANSGQNACLAPSSARSLLRELADVIFRPQMHKKPLAAGLRPYPLGELKRSPDPLAVGVAASRPGRGSAGEVGPLWKFLYPPVAAGGVGASVAPMFFMITFLSPNIFSLLSISHQYIDAHFGGNRLQLSFRVLEIYFLSVRSISGKTEDVYQHTDRLPTYFTRRTSTSMTHIGT